MAYHQPFQVIGFHSCDKEVGIKVLNGELDAVEQISNKSLLKMGTSYPINPPSAGYVFLCRSLSQLLP